MQSMLGSMLRRELGESFYFYFSCFLMVVHSFFSHGSWYKHYIYVITADAML